MLIYIVMHLVMVADSEHGTKPGLKTDSDLYREVKWLHNLGQKFIVVA